MSSPSVDRSESSFCRGAEEIEVSGFYCHLKLNTEHIV